MYAIIRTGGKQYRVEEGDELNVELLATKEGDIVEFNDVLLVHAGDAVMVGRPLVEGATVVGRVLGHGKAKKILVFKYKAKKNYRRRFGHRQPYTRVRIEEIRVPATGEGTAAEEAQSPAAEVSFNGA
ncbi:MAG TPA: 50S ribosomal protein L21 [Firmicutes bacterium]|nr:50S ribosomal protein L21 [Bacillota bacterium]